MLAASAPTPPPPPPPVRTDTRVVEPNEQWKAELHKRIEDGLRNMVQEVRIVRDTILNSRPSESSRELAFSNYETSMNDIRMLAQEEFTRQLRIEMSERKWALDVVFDSNSPDVARQQQWILNSIRKTDEDHTTTSPSGASHSPPQQGDGEHGFDGSPEEGYESAGLGDEGGESGESRETSEEDDEDEEEGEDWDEENAAPRQSRPPSRPNVPLTRPLQSKSPVSRRNTPSGQGSNFHATEDKEDKDAYDSHGHSVQRHPYSLGGAPRRQTSGSQSSLWRPVPRAPEPSSMPRTTTFSHTIGQKYNTGPAQFPSRGSVSSTGSTSNGAGLHRAGSLNSEQYRSSSVAPHSGAERTPTQNRDRIASNIASRERQTSASASPHEKPSLPSYPTVSPRAIPGARPPPLDDAVRFPTSARPGSRMMYSLQRSPEDMRPGVVIPRGPPTPDDGPRGTSWSSLNSRRSLGDFNLHRRHNSKGDRLPPVDGDLSDASDDAVGQLDDRHSIRSIRSVHSMRSIDLEQRAAWLEAEAKRKEEEATRKEEEASKKEDEARRLEEKARQSLEEAKRLEAGPRQAEASAKMREAAAQNKEAEAKRKEAEAKKREAESQKREAEAQRKEEQARQMEREARRKEEQARRKEEEAQRKEDEARKREEVRRKEDDARKREDDARRREEDARQREMVARQKEEDVVGQLNVRQSMHSLCDIRSARSLGSVDLEERALWIEAEAKRMKEEARKKEDEARRLEEKARQSLEEAKRLEAGARQAEASAKMREAAAKNKETEAKRKEAEAKKREAESQKREAEAQRKEDQVRQMEREARRKEEQARRKEEEAQRKEDEVRKREEEVRRKEDDARKREDDTRREEDVRQREMVARQKEDDVVGQLDFRQSMHSFCDIRSVRSLGSVDLEERALWIEAEAKRRDEEASKKEDEVRRLEEKARRSLEEAKRLEAGARQAEASAKMREAAAKNKETEAKRKEAEAKKREVESQKREAEAQRKEEQVRQMEREARRKEDEVRKREEEVRRKEGRAQARG